MRTEMHSARTWMVAVAMVGMVAVTSAQQPGGPAVAAPAAPAQTQTVDRYVVGQAKPPVEPGQSLRDLTLQQAIDLALENNLSLKAAKMNPQIQDYALVQARAAFRPTLSSNFNLRNQSRVSVSTNDGVPAVITRSQTYGAAWNQNLSKFGSSYTANFSTDRQSNNTLNSTRPLAFNGSTQFSYTQPILANFKIDDRRNTLRTQAIQRQIVDVQLQQTIENTKASVRTAYWALRRNIEQIEIQRRALELSQRLLQDNKTKVEIGTMAPIDIVQNEANVAANEQALLNAQINWSNSQLQFRQLLASGPEDTLYSQTINPTEQPPALEQVTVDIPKAVQTALTQRTDLVQSRKTLESSAFSMEVRRNATLPGLNLTASYSLAGVGGNEYNSANFLRTTVKKESGYGDVWRGVVDRDQPTWSVQANFTYPLGMQSARAQLASEQIRYQQSQANLKAQELTVQTDVTAAGLSVSNTWLQLQAARKSREAAERQAEAEQTRFDNGMSNNYNIALAQNDLTSRRLSELNAIIAYVNAIADFEKKQRAGGN